MPRTGWVRDGHRTTKRKGKVQKYLCRDCGKRCSGLPGLGRRHASAATISDALSLVSKGVSLARVAEDISRRGPKFHRSTIYRWIAAYGPLMEGARREDPSMDRVQVALRRGLLQDTG